MCSLRDKLDGMAAGVQALGKEVSDLRGMVVVLGAQQQDKFMLELLRALQLASTGPPRQSNTSAARYFPGNEHC